MGAAAALLAETENTDNFGCNLLLSHFGQTAFWWP